MSREHFIVAWLMAALLFMPPALSAQQVGPGETARWHDVAARLEPAAFISIRLKDGSHMKGTLMGVSDTSFSFKPKTRIPVAAREIPFEDVVSIERAKQGMNPGQKVLVGAAGVVGGTILVLLLLLANLD